MPAQNRRGLFGSLALLFSTILLAGLLGTATPAHAGWNDRPHFKMPFRCGQVWKGQTFWRHNPLKSVDWNHYAKDGSRNDFKRRVLASAGGRVVASYRSSSGYGNTIVIAHGKGWRTRYAHLWNRTVDKGDKVRRGRFIGRVGKSGGQSSAHLHYEQIFRGDVVISKIQGQRWTMVEHHNQKSRNCRR